MESSRNSQRLTVFINEELADTGYRGAVGVAEFKKVYDELMPAQKSKLRSLCNDRFQDLQKEGSIICVGLAYPEHAIDCIDVKLEDGTADVDAWNLYAREYHKLNTLLNAISRDIANHFEGLPISATVERVAVKNVDEYYEMAVSHRTIAENAGLGWRGKNGLVINERLSCALRFASVITRLPFIYGRKVETMCGECEACLEACQFLRNKDQLRDYRESCRRYILKLDLEGMVCGKCVKACYRHSIFSNRFRLK